MIPWLAPRDPFPPVNAALTEPNGLLAASADLSVARLIAAYERGIFPWYSEPDPVLWWSPDPRMVLFVVEFEPRQSLRKTIRKVRKEGALELRIDTAFEAVMRACAQPRRDGAGTWITERMVQAYSDLHRLGLAHSVEVWQANSIVGGLYGVSLGRMFYGESMFSRIRDASKIALAALVALLRREDAYVIDCQQKTAHLASLGAREIPRDTFCEIVLREVKRAPLPWSQYAGRRNDLLADY
ncbi:MAG: leucyl/phenylalanyl-tRNA--protein transferase [Sutterellaceae bacterium]|nr:leucyl/phenylalanyl-tRNA--protein transferase [Burkholderiaceae bacterium]MCX7901591.1 leucyl/phenylalanyl-tRNA--protein transferase [Burkholderiaceae bacterium]MDW8429318.1 leucyl/phenylalanyl-tRNA--protein transferase [Sutterellaceae bacterium]